MNESKHEIPAPMLEAATKAILAANGLSPETCAPGSLELSQRDAEAALEAAGVAVMAARIAELEADAKRYRWLREQDWDTGPLAVVRDPKLAVKPGYDLPSRERLDEEIDAAMNAPSGAGGGE